MPRVFQHFCSDVCSFASNMDSVPDAFFDAICSQLESKDLGNLQKIYYWWSSLAASHDSKRRKIFVILNVNAEGTQVGIRINDINRNACTFSALKPRYDRIASISVGLLEMDDFSEKTSLECFEKTVMPWLLSLVFKCKLDLTCQALPRNFADSIVNGLRGCSQLSRILIANYDGCAEFIKLQISLGHLKDLDLRGSYKCPDDMNLSLKSFLRSPNFESLYLSESNLKLDFDMVNCFVERFRKGNIASSAYLEGKVSFPLERFDYLFVDKQENDRYRRYNGRSSTKTSTVANRKFQVIVSTDLSHDNVLRFDIRSLL
uniref:FBA_2 domain-containing protein n=1 Tax=Steinernema glaseri TaxID=37863 RepID=A0A1I7YJ09_9BILA